MAEERFDIKELEAEVERDHGESYDKLIHIQNPSLCWPGTDSYWCKVEINDVLEANGIALEPSPSTKFDVADEQDEVPAVRM